MADYIYIGPTLSRYGLKNFETYKDRPSGNILELMNKYPAVASLVVPQAELVAKQKEVNKKGTALYAAYQSLSDESAFGSNAGNGPIITPTEPIPPYKNSYFNTPVPGKQYNSAGEIVNPADYFGSNGLRVEGTFTVGGGEVINITLHNNATSAGNGMEFAPANANSTLTFEIVGTSTSRTIVFEIAGPSGVYGPYTAFNVSDPTKFGSQTTGGSNTAPESWQVEVPAGYKFRARISAVAGGNVSVKGKAVS